MSNVHSQDQEGAQAGRKDRDSLASRITLGAIVVIFLLLGSAIRPEKSVFWELAKQGGSLIYQMEQPEIWQPFSHQR